ncbi:MAG TPA: PKD domain-containing protein, partial [Ktedonobacterales bacterium]|nr:PKD domain-containing protein [Ktedonobacterales bacterium]
GRTRRGEGIAGGWNWHKHARLLALALLGGLGLSALALLPMRGWNTLPTARACGFVTAQVMLANGDPSLVHPVPVGVNVPANQPLGIFALPYETGQAIKFTEDLSRVINAPAAGQYSLRWDFGDGSAPMVAISPTHAFAQPGTYNVNIDYMDASSPDWVPSFDGAQIHVVAPAALLPSPPVAHIVASATSIATRQSITFDATGSHALVGSHLTYLWNFNDYSTATGAHVAHEFDFGTGNTFVALLVTDDRGATAVARLNIAVVANPQQLPTAALTASTTQPRQGQSVSFDASGSTPALVPVGDQLASYSWDFGDGTPQQTTQMPAIAHAFAQPGQYAVTVRAIDQAGTPAQAGLMLTVGGLPDAVVAGGPNWLLLVGIVVALLAAAGGGLFALRQQRQRAALARQRVAAEELRRARRVPTGGVRPGDPRWGDPRAGARGGPPSRARERDTSGDARDRQRRLPGAR